MLTLFALSTPDAQNYILTTTSDANGETISTVSTSSTTLEVSRLQPDTVYRLAVRAYTNDGILTGQSEVLVTTGTSSAGNVDAKGSSQLLKDGCYKPG